MPNLFITSFLSQLLAQLPSFTLWGVGIALSLLNYSKNPKKFLLTTISFSIFLVMGITSLFFQTWLTIQFGQDGLSTSQSISGLQILSCVNTFTWLVSWVILLIAIFNQKYNPVEVAADEFQQE